MTSHTLPWKEKQLAEIKELASKYSVIAVADISMYPAALFQKVRKKLHGKAVVKVSKTRIIKKALSDDSRINVLTDFAKENCALIFTEMNPFELFSFLKKNKGKVFAKEGSIAENDIIISAGDTGLPPGPALSDLKAAGLKVAVKGPTISIVNDKVVTKAGEPVNGAVAGILSKLNIKPFKVGLKIVTILEGTQLFNADVLDIDIDEVFSNFVSAHKKAFNLAMNAVIFTTETTELLVAKAFNNAKAVAIEGNILNSVTVGNLLSKANAQANAIKPLIKEEAKEASKEEEKKEETSVEETSKTTDAPETPVEEKKEDNVEGAWFFLIKIHEVNDMEYVYAAMLLHSGKKEITEEAVKKVLAGAGVESDDARIKALVASLKEVNIEEAIEKAAVVAPVAATAAPASGDGAKAKEEVEEDKGKSEEEAAEGLGSLFG